MRSSAGSATYSTSLPAQELLNQSMSYPASTSLRLQPVPMSLDGPLSADSLTPATYNFSYGYPHTSYSPSFSPSSLLPPRRRSSEAADYDGHYDRPGFASSSSQHRSRYQPYQSRDSYMNSLYSAPYVPPPLESAPAALGTAITNPLSPLQPVTQLPGASVPGSSAQDADVSSYQQPPHTTHPPDLSHRSGRDHFHPAYSTSGLVGNMPASPLAAEYSSYWQTDPYRQPPLPSFPSSGYPYTPTFSYHSRQQSNHSEQQYRDLAYDRSYRQPSSPGHSVKDRPQ